MSTTLTGPTGRLAYLLNTIRRQGGRWSAIRVIRLYRHNAITVPAAQIRTVARGDLRDLAVWGYLVLHDTPGDRFYTLNTRKDGDQ